MPRRVVNLGCGARCRPEGILNACGYDLHDDRAVMKVVPKMVQGMCGAPAVVLTRDLLGDATEEREEAGSLGCASE
jgi:hypothetical protein